jgi:hypothetical protein
MGIMWEVKKIWINACQHLKCKVLLQTLLEYCIIIQPRVRNTFPSFAAENTTLEPTLKETAASAQSTCDQYENGNVENASNVVGYDWEHFCVTQEWEHS